MYLIFAQTSEELGLVDGSTCFLVDRKTEGFSTRRVHDKMGERLRSCVRSRVAQAAYDRALDWCGNRVQGGKPLIEHSSVAQTLAHMRMEVDAARAYVHQAAWLADHPEQGWDGTLGALPKVFASEVAWRMVTECLELHGGYGYMKEMGIEKLVRDAAAFLHSDGANSTLLLKAARFLGP